MRRIRPRSDRPISQACDRGPEKRAKACWQELHAEDDALAFEHTREGLACDAVDAGAPALDGEVYAGVRDHALVIGLRERPPHDPIASHERRKGSRRTMPCQSKAPRGACRVQDSAGAFEPGSHERLACADCRVLQSLDAAPLLDAPIDALPVLSFADARAWSRWLASHHASSRGVWLKIAKKGSKSESVTYAEALEVALIWGWIDGQKGKLDDAWWLQRFTPRGPKSIWSKTNREKAVALIEAGKMKPPGLAEVERAKRDGRWEAAYDSQSRATVPPDLAKALAANPRAARSSRRWSRTTATPSCSASTRRRSRRRGQLASRSSSRCWRGTRSCTLRNHGGREFGRRFHQRRPAHQGARLGGPAREYVSYLARSAAAFSSSSLFQRSRMSRPTSVFPLPVFILRMASALARNLKKPLAASPICVHRTIGVPSGSRTRLGRRIRSRRRLVAASSATR